MTATPSSLLPLPHDATLTLRQEQRRVHSKMLQMLTVDPKHFLQQAWGRLLHSLFHNLSAGLGLVHVVLALGNVHQCHTAHQRLEVRYMHFEAVYNAVVAAAAACSIVAGLPLRPSLPPAEVAAACTQGFKQSSKSHVSPTLNAINDKRHISAHSIAEHSMSGNASRCRSTEAPMLIPAAFQAGKEAVGHLEACTWLFLLLPKPVSVSKRAYLYAAITATGATLMRSGAQDR